MRSNGRLNRGPGNSSASNLEHDTTRALVDRRWSTQAFAPQRWLRMAMAVLVLVLAAGQADAQQSPTSGWGSLIDRARKIIKQQPPVECVEADQACIDRARKSGAEVRILPPALTSSSTVAIQPTPSGATSSSSLNPEHPSHLSLFQMWMATHADVLGADEAAAWEHYLITRIPSDPTTGVGMSAECQALRQRLSNEITAEKEKAVAVAEFKTALAKAAGSPRTGTFGIRTWERLGRYDSTRGVFALELVASSVLPAGARVVVPRTPMGLLSPEEASQLRLTAPTYCMVTPSHPIELKPQVLGQVPFAGATRGRVAGWFSLELRGQGELTEFPMDRASAEAFLNNINPDRLVGLELQVEVGPVPLRQVGLGGLSVPARISAARVLDRDSGRVLHTFETTASLPSAIAPTRERTTDTALAFSGNRALLLTLRDHPQLATQDALIDMTSAQVSAEQAAWRNMSYATNPANGANRNTWNPKKRSFIYEWQSLVDSQPALAAGPVMDAFLHADPDWSFVTRDPAWDPRFDALVSVHLFARDKVEGRDPSFVSRELVPVYERHLGAAVSRAPTSFWLSVPLAGLDYNFASEALRVSGMVPGQRSGMPEDTDLLRRLSSDSGVTLPDAARGRAIYTVVGALQSTQVAEPRAVQPGVALNGSSAPTDTWRGFGAIGSSWRKIPIPGILALDRRVQITPIPMAPAQAELLLTAQRARPGQSILSARLYFDAESVHLGSVVIERQKEPSAVLLGSVKKIEVVDGDNRVIATAPGTSLPSPAAVPPVSAAAPTRPVQAGSTLADRQAERRRQDEEEAEQSRRISEGLEQLAKKQSECSLEVAKLVGATPEATQKALAACMAR